MSVARWGIVAGVVMSGLLVGAATGRAATFNATELGYDNALFSQFNLINLGNYTGNAANATAANIQGRAVVGGNLTVGGAAQSIGANNPAGTSSNPGLSSNAVGVNANNNPFSAVTAFGNVTAANGLSSYGSGGTINVGGAATGTFTLNGGSFGTNSDGAGAVINNSIANRTTAAAGTFKGTTNNGRAPTYTSLAAEFPFSQNGSSLADNFTTPAKALYSGIANLPGSANVTTENIPVSYSGAFTTGVDYTSTPAMNGTGNTYKYGVVQTTLADLATLAKGGFTGVVNGAGNNATFVIVNGTYDGTAATLLPSLTANSQNVIYDFVGASSLKLGNGATFNGSILAPLASLTEGTTGSITGTVIVAAMTQTINLYSGPTYNGDLTGLSNFTYNSRVPEPASLALLGTGIGLAAWIRRRRRKD